MVCSWLFDGGVLVLILVDVTVALGCVRYGFLLFSKLAPYRRTQLRFRSKKNFAAVAFSWNVAPSYADIASDIPASSRQGPDVIGVQRLTVDCSHGGPGLGWFHFTLGTVGDRS
jgi:hypothetical protein